MSFHFEGIYTCCKCHTKVHVGATVVDGLTFDDEEVTVKVPQMPQGWESDGLGGYMCRTCHKDWKPE